jgi:formylglycine-generating enzyme required for sulfatase activity
MLTVCLGFGGCRERDGQQEDRQNAKSPSKTASHAAINEVVSGTPLRPELVLVVPGTFVMGSPAAELQQVRTAGGWAEFDSLLYRSDEIQHQVTLTHPFLMMKTEVTQAQFQEATGRLPSSFKECGARCPVDSVTLEGVREYADALSVSEGLEPCHPPVFYERYAEPTDDDRQKLLGCLGYRLPSEAEWEYAARAGEKRATPNGDLTLEAFSSAVPELEKIAWYGGNSGVSYSPAGECQAAGSRAKTPCGPHPVGTKLANAWGLHDMLGNVSEWVLDTHSYYEESATVDPLQGGGTHRLTRGGFWGESPLRHAARSAAHHGGAPHIGFRLVRTVSPSQVRP